MNELDLNWARAEMAIIRSVQAYEQVLLTRVSNGFIITNGNFQEEARKWFLVTEEMKSAIVAEYKELFGKEKSFEEIRSEAKLMLDRLAQNTAQIEYPEDKISKER